MSTLPAAEAADGRAPGPRYWPGIAFGVATALIWGIQPIVSKLSVADGLTAAAVQEGGAAHARHQHGCGERRAKERERAAAIH